MRVLLTVSFIIALLSVCQLEAQVEGGIEQARALLGSNKETDARQGAAICLKLDNAEAAKELFIVLERAETPDGWLATAHFRDVVFESLENMKSPDVHRRVLKGLRSRDPHVRQWCAELLGIYSVKVYAADPSKAPCSEFGPALEKALKDSRSGVQQWAARSLGMIRYTEAQPALKRLVRDRNDYIRANAIEALARIDAEKHRERFQKAVVKDRDGGVRCALLGAAGEIYPDLCESLSTEALFDEDWRARLQGVENLTALRSGSATGALVEATRDPRPVVKVRAVKSLQELTGHGAFDYEGWQKWWAAQGGTFEVPEKVKKQEEERAPVDEDKTAVYHGIELFMGPNLVTDHVAFLIDRSDAMKKKLTSIRRSKESAARKELNKILVKLEGMLTFSVYVYHETIRPFSKRPIRLTKKSRKGALRFVKESKEGKQKDIWQLLKAVVEDPELDTAFLLSSGEPDIGTYVHWNRVTSHLKDLNRFHKVTIHTVAYSDSQWYRDQLQRIAEATGGEFKFFQ